MSAIRVSTCSRTGSRPKAPIARLRYATVAAALGLVLGTCASATAAGGQRIVVTDTIQAAVNSAQPGDTVVVPPGVYRESVQIHTGGITLTGSRGAIIDATGFPTGITASSGPIVRHPGAPATCPPPILADIAVQGLTVRNAGFTGVLLRGVDGFDISGGRYLDNAEYGVFPVCSHAGRISGNEVEGSDDAALYIGNSDTVAITGNQVSDSTVGVEIENSAAITATDNHVSGNTAGVVAFVLPNLPQPFSRDLLIADNVVSFNNRPNPVPPDSNEPIGRVPTGTGVLALGSDDVRIAGNRVIGNNSGGIAVLSNPLATDDPRVDAAPDNNQLVGNVARRNGLDPDTARSILPGADLLFDVTGTGTCFARNVFDVEFPLNITAVFTCPTQRLG